MTDSQLKAVFSHRLKEAVKYSGHNYKYLADKLGVNQTTVSMYVHGKTLPSFLTLANISEILDISIDYLIGKNEF